MSGALKLARCTKFTSLCAFLPNGLCLDSLAQESGVVEVVDHLPGFNAEAGQALRLDIWDEDVIVNHNLKIGAGNNVSAGTLNSLIQLLSDYDSYFDTTVSLTVAEEFKRVFFLSLNSFTSPDILLTKIIQLYDVPDELDDIDVSLHQLSVIGMIKHWIELCGDWDWKSDKLRSKLLKFIEGGITTSGHVLKVRELKSLLNKTTTKPAVRALLNLFYLCVCLCVTDLCDSSVLFFSCVASER